MILIKYCMKYLNIKKALTAWQIDSILEKLDTQNCEVKCVSLIADENTLRKRLSADVERGIRSEDVIERSIARIPMYQALNTIKINTNAKTVAIIANEIKRL